MVGRLIAAAPRASCCKLLLGLVRARRRRRWPTCCSTGPATTTASNLSALEAEIEAFVDQYHGTPLAQLSLARCWPT